MAPRAAKLVAFMERAIRELPAQIRDDARAILHIEILSGRLKSKDELPLALKRATRDAWREQPSRWQESLDAPVHPDSKRSRVEDVADPSEWADPAAVYEREIAGKQD
jgi:hypothetical protein